MRRYLFDTSSFIQLEERYPREIIVFQPIYETLDCMFENGEIFSIMEVFNELEDSQELWNDYKKYFRYLNEKEYENIDKILSSKDFETFVKWGLQEKSHYWADPYLIACALENPEITIVTEESSANHPKRKIPFVCGELGIICINLLEFFKQIS